MNDYKAILKEHEHLREVVKCAILHEEEKRNVEIARELEISAVKVTRYLQEARERGIITIEVHPPQEVRVAEIVRKIFNLREVYVFPVGIEEEITDMLARLSVAYMEERLDDEKEEIKQIAIGPGSTMLAFVRALPPKKRKDMMVKSTTSPTLTETYMASNTLIGTMSDTWECESHRFDPEMSPEEQREYADMLIFGIERIPDMEGVTASALLSESDITRSELEKEFYRLALLGGICIINYQAINREGKLLGWDIRQYDKVLGSTLLKIKMIKQIAADEKKRVICIAGGEDKVDALKAGLLGGYFNILITNYKTAVGLLEGQE